MPITVVPQPGTLGWSDFSPVRALSNGEEAHVDPGYTVQNRPLRRVGNQWMLAETLELRVFPRARVLRTARQTAELLAHEQGHYDIGLLAGRALARDLATITAPTPAALKHALDAAFDLHARTRLGPIQHAYDHDTNHSQNVKEQQRWAGLISAALAATAATAINNMTL